MGHLASCTPSCLSPPLHLPQVISQKEGDFFFDSLWHVSDWVKKNKPQKEGEKALGARLGPQRRVLLGSEVEQDLSASWAGVRQLPWTLAHAHSFIRSPQVPWLMGMARPGARQ